MATDDHAVQVNFDYATIECEGPNEFIYKFEGIMRISSNDKDNQVKKESSTSKKRKITDPSIEPLIQDDA
jgi:hypothetical protein